MPEREYIAQRSESEAIPDPQEALEDFLADEAAGSIRIKAVADFAKRTMLKRKLKLEIRDGLEGGLANVRKNPNKMATLLMNGISTSVQIAQVEEMKREREFGEQGADYASTYDEFAENIFPMYVDHEKTKLRQRGIQKDVDDETFVSLARYQAAKTVDDDLFTINSDKSLND